MPDSVRLVVCPSRAKRPRVCVSARSVGDNTVLADHNKSARQQSPIIAARFLSNRTSRLSPNTHTEMNCLPACAAETDTFIWRREHRRLD